MTSPNSTRRRSRGAARPGAALALAGLLGYAGAAQAHFQLLYSGATALPGPAQARFVMVFTHPAHGGPHMDMGEPRAFYVVSQRGEDAPVTRTDLREHLRPIEWHGAEGKARAYAADLPRQATRSLGDYVFVLEAAPYYESGEDKYIQQITKTVINVGGVPGNWAEPVGLPAEIVPLDKPYANWTGGVFRGVVLADGKPVPHAELEVEYLNYRPDTETHRFAEQPEVVLPHAAFGTMGIRANANGEFTIGLPRAGWWGICALGVGPHTEHEGKPLSQDAVLWIEVQDMRSP